MTRTVDFRQEELTSASGLGIALFGSTGRGEEPQTTMQMGGLIWARVSSESPASQSSKQASAPRGVTPNMGRRRNVNRAWAHTKDPSRWSQVVPRMGRLTNVHLEPAWLWLLRARRHDQNRIAKASE